jgi:hypothetical protein
MHYIFYKNERFNTMIKINFSIDQLLRSRNILRAAGAAVLASFSVLASAVLPYDEPIPVAKVVFHA